MKNFYVYVDVISMYKSTIEAKGKEEAYKKAREELENGLMAENDYSELEIKIYDENDDYILED